MSFELIRVRKFGSAEFAGIRSFAGVHAEMPTEVGDLHEVAVTVCALVRLLPGVEPHVRLEVVIAGEPLFTHATAERLLACVGSLVVLQHVLVPEGTVTCLTGKRLLATRYHIPHAATAALHHFRRGR